MAEEGVTRVGRRVFVQNLEWKTSWQDLKDRFRECGNVVFSNVALDEKQKSKGWGIVEYDTAQEAVEAIKTINGTELHGRKLLVREDREDRDVKQYNAENGLQDEEHPRPQRPPRTHVPRASAAGRGRGRGRGAGRGAGMEGESSGLQIVVQGLPFSYASKELQAMFEGMTGLEHAEIVMGRDRRSRGYGTVRFTSVDGAQEGIRKYNETDLEGRTLSVKLDKWA